MEGLPKRSVPTSKRFQQTQAQVEQVVDIMRVNVDKVLERDEKLSELDGRADALQAGASQFEASAGKLKRKFWWRNVKIMLMLASIILLIVIIVVVVIVTNRSKTIASESLVNQTSTFSPKTTPAGEAKSTTPGSKVPAWMLRQTNEPGQQQSGEYVGTEDLSSQEQPTEPISSSSSS